MTQDELAVAAPEALQAFEIEEGYADMLNPSEGAAAASRQLLAATRAERMLSALGGMTATEFRDMLSAMMEATNAAGG